MAQNQGTLVGAPIRPADDRDQFPSALANEIKGGYHIVETIAERNAITEARRVFGMICYVSAENKEYRLESRNSSLTDNTNWEEVEFGEEAPVKSVNSKIGDVVINKGDVGLSNVTNHAQVRRDEIGQTNGVTPLDSNKLVPPEYLPSYVDDVVDILWFIEDGGLPPTTGFAESDKIYIIQEKALYEVVGGDWIEDEIESDKIYLNLNQNSDGVITQWRWSGTNMVQITNGAVTLGETDKTAYRGDRGKIAYDHTLKTDNPHRVTKAQVGLGNVDNTSDMQKPVSTAQAQAIAIVQDDLNNYRDNEVGVNFPDYSTILITGLDF